MTPSRSIPWFVCAGLFASFGCGESATVRYGELNASWSVLPAGCEAAGVESVEIEISDPAKPETIERRSLYNCDSASVILDSVPTGNRLVRVVGLDESGTATFIAEPLEVLVHPDNVASVRVGLTSAPGRVRATWAFQNGLLCGTNGIETVHVRIFDDYDYLVSEFEEACSTANVDFDELNAGAYLVHAESISEEGVSFTGSSKVLVDRGETARTDLVLSEQ